MNGTMILKSNRLVLGDDPSYKYRVIKTEEGFFALKEEWNDLWFKSKGGFSQTFSYNLHCWKYIAKEFKRNLNIVIQYKDDRISAIFPLTIEQKGLWKLLRPLGLVAAEFTDILTVKDEFYFSKTLELWNYILLNFSNDIINLPFVKNPTGLNNAVLSGNNKILNAENDTAYFVKWNESDTWESYQKELGGDHRRSLSRRKRHLDSEGLVEFHVISDPVPLISTISWLLDTKKKWVIKNNKIDPWMFSDHYKNVLFAMVNDKNRIHPLIAFTLTLNGKIISTKLTSIGLAKVDRIIAAYNEEYAKSSPGMILDEFVIKWTFDNKLNCDLGVGSEKSKQIWSRGHYDPTVNYLIAANSWGAIGYNGWNFLKKAKNFKGKIKGTSF